MIRAFAERLRTRALPLTVIVAEAEALAIEVDAERDLYVVAHAAIAERLVAMTRERDELVEHVHTLQNAGTPSGVHETTDTEGDELS